MFTHTYAPIRSRRSPRNTRLNPFGTRSISIVGCTLAAGLALSGCAAAPLDENAAQVVTLAVHDSFPAEAFEVAASEATGLDVQVITAGDGGELTNKLVLTSGAPIADGFFGIDNVFASRLIDNEVIEPYLSPSLPDRASDYAYDTAGSLTPITLGATCINIDPAWFAAEGIAEPSTYEDLIDPRYAGLSVLLDPTSSSTGASFLAGTVAVFGEDGYAEYWQRLSENGARIEQSWGDAYNGQFTQGGGEGTYPIVLSYSSSPAWTIADDGTSTATAALLDTCSSQVEYAGVLDGATNAEGARTVIDYLLSREFQDTIAETMYVYPVDPSAVIPDDWQTFAPMPASPHDLTAAEIGAGREKWLKTWSDATGW